MNDEELFKRKLKRVCDAYDEENGSYPEPALGGEDLYKFYLNMWKRSRADIIKNIVAVKKGCGKKVDSNGDCWYISSQGKLRLCSTCTRKLKKLEVELEARAK